MISESVQEKIRLGDEDAFRRLYGEYSGDIFRSAKAALKDESRARNVVKTVMVTLYRDMCDAGAAIDTDERVEILTGLAIVNALNVPSGAESGENGQNASVSSPADRSGAAEKKRVSAGSIFASVGAVLFFTVALWALAGILMALGILPVKDLGYTFFDTHVFPLFLLK